MGLIYGDIKEDCPNSERIVDRELDQERKHSDERRPWKTCNLDNIDEYVEQ